MAAQRKSLPMTASNIHKTISAGNAAGTAARRSTQSSAASTAKRGTQSSAAGTAKRGTQSSAAGTAKRGTQSSAAGTAKRGTQSPAAGIAKRSTQSLAAGTAKRNSLSPAAGTARRSAAVHIDNKKTSSLTASERRYREVQRARIILGCVILVVVAVIAALLIPKKKTVNEGQLLGVNPDVLQYADAVKEACRQYGIEEYSTLMLAVMQQESSGQGTDVFQCSESPFNTEYSNAPGSITDVSYSISVGAQTFAYCLEQAGCKSLSDTEALKTALQEYNFGSDYAGWAIANYGGYSEENALEFSEKMKAELGWDAYGDPLYVPHVLQYIDLS